MKESNLSLKIRDENFGVDMYNLQFPHEMIVYLMLEITRLVSVWCMAE